MDCVMSVIASQTVQNLHHGIVSYLQLNAFDELFDF